ncbi:MAG: hypothetical protein WCJ61_00165 [Paludibacter sp.]
MKKQSSKSVLIIFSLFMLTAMSSCNSSDSKDAKNKVYTSNGVGVTGTESGEMFGGNLSGFKGRASSNGAATSGINMPGSVSAPSASISQVDVEKVSQRQVARSSISGVNGYTQSQSKTFKSSNIDNSALQQNTPKADINNTLKARATESETTASTGTKAKSSVAAKSGPQKSGPPKPGEPGYSLPIGDGTWMLLLMSGMYAIRKNFKFSISSMG